MANELVIVAEINTLEAEGFLLGKEWKAICKADAKRFTGFTKANGFDTRLGKLMQALKAEGGDRISTKRLMDCGINEIDKRRRSEALWFVENEVACREFIQASKKGFTSLTALQSAMAKAAKKPADVTEGDTAVAGGDSDSEVSNEVSSEAVKSNVGPTDLATQFLAIAKQNGISVLDIIDAMLELETGTDVDTLAAKAA